VQTISAAGQEPGVLEAGEAHPSSATGAGGPVTLCLGLRHFVWLPRAEQINCIPFYRSGGTMAAYIRRYTIQCSAGRPGAPDPFLFKSRRLNFDQSWLDAGGGGNYQTKTSRVWLPLPCCQVFTCVGWLALSQHTCCLWTFGPRKGVRGGVRRGHAGWPSGKHRKPQYTQRRG
jgi:hypothetical protein